MENNSILNILLLAGGVVFALFFFAMLAKLYRKASPERALIRTGWGGRKVVTDGARSSCPSFTNSVT